MASKNFTPKELPRLPDHGKGIERQALGQGEAGDRREAEQRRANCEYGSKAGSQPMLEQGEKAAARAIPKQRC